MAEEMLTWLLFGMLLGYPIGRVLGVLAFDWWQKRK